VKIPWMGHHVQTWNCHLPTMKIGIQAQHIHTTKMQKLILHKTHGNLHTIGECVGISNH
jgi:hypothetical protein